VQKSRWIAGVLTLLAVSPVAYGASFMVPTDGELVALAKGIVIATNVSSYPLHVPDGWIDTVYEFQVEEVIKGDIDVSAPLRLVEGGGAIDGQYTFVPEAPGYRVGERALIFIGTNKRGENCTWGMILGKFDFVHDLHGEKLLIRGADEGEIFGWDACWNHWDEPIRAEAEFLNFVRATACGKASAPNYFVAKENVVWRLQPRNETNSAGFHADDYQYTSVSGGGGLRPGGIRWKDIFDQPGGGGSVTFQIVGNEASVPDPMGGIDNAMAAWNGNALSNVNYRRGPAGSAPFGTDDGINSIHLDDATDVPVSAIGFSSYHCAGDLYPFDGAQMCATTDADVAIAPGIGSQKVYEEALTHELGHTLSFRHSGDKAPATSIAVMNAISSGSYGAVLQPWDHDAVSTVYNPNPAACIAPSIEVQAQTQTITCGQSANLSVTVSGTAPLSYQWYLGASGNTGTPVGTNSPNFNTGPLTSTTTQYWVRVTGQCAPNADSTTATITVSPSGCTPPSITVQPQSQTIFSGQQAFLSVTASGSGPFQYQWYKGATGNTSTPVGPVPTLTPALAFTTQIWVRVTGQCNPPADSATATITVIPGSGCNPPSIVAQPGSGSINQGQSATLIVGASGTAPFSYQWYIGTPPNASNPVPVGTTQSISVSPATTTTYWVRVTDRCNLPTDSAAATITVNDCTPPSITAQPAGQQIAVGSSTTLSVAAAGTGPLHYQWFQGTSCDTSMPVGTDSSSFTTPLITSETSFWVRVTGQCSPTAISATAAIDVKSGRQRAVRH